MKYLLVDGYNIIFSWEQLRKLAIHSLDHARVRLCNMLSNFSGFTSERVIVVFDAHKVNGGKGDIIYTDEIIIVYTKEKETADTYIERTSKVLSKKYTVRVATSDITEQIIIIGSGAKVVSAKSFEEEIKILNKEISKKINNRPVKNNMLSDNIDKKSMDLLNGLRFSDVANNKNKNIKKLNNK
ncbi:MAG: NYN domain-containing protein [Defluviitaleaceae bacterium]|nr:NYN domain-containing protein [Defluviitaleaceae bacterium]